MPLDKPPGQGIQITRNQREERVASTDGGIEIRREGRPIESSSMRGGSVYLVVDCSSSMVGHKLAQAKDGGLDFGKEALAKNYSVGLVSFASTATHICEPQRDTTALGPHLSTLVANGSTDMAAGIELATAKLRGSPGSLAMVVITDGAADNEEAALTASREARVFGIDIITVGTDAVDRSFLEKLASRKELVVVVAGERLGPGIKSSASMLPQGNSQPKER